MKVAFITFKSSLVPLIEGLCSSNPCEFVFSGFRRNRTDDLGINLPHSDQLSHACTWGPYLCDNQALLKAVKRWVGEGGKMTLVGAPDADILLEGIEELPKRTTAEAATWFSAHPTPLSLPPSPSGELGSCELGVFRSHCFLLFLLRLIFKKHSQINKNCTCVYTLVCSWKIYVWTGTGLFVFRLTSSMLFRILQLQGHLFDCSRFHMPFNFWDNPHKRWGYAMCSFWNFVCCCAGHTSFSESSQRRSHFLPAIQTSIFQEQTNIHTWKQ